MLLCRAAASEVFQLDQHGQSAFKLAVQVRFVAGKLLQLVGLQPFANGLVHDGIVVAGLFFLLVTQGRQVLGDKAGQAFCIGRVLFLFQVAFPPLP